MRYTELKLLIVPVLLFLVFFGVEYHEAHWDVMRSETHPALQTLLWVAGAWLLARLIRVFIWQRRPKRLTGAAPPRLLQHTVNLIIVALVSAAIAKTVFHQPLTGFWATSGVVGIILGVALRGIIADFFSGIALEWDPPFQIGDYIEVQTGKDPLIGRVTEVTWRATQIVPRDGTNTVFVPNSVMASIAVNNVYRPLGKTRFELFISFDPGIPHDRVLRVLTSAAMSVPDAAEDLPPEIVATQFHASGVEYKVRYWLPPDVSPTGARNRLMAAILDLARRCDLHVAFPHEEVIFEPKRPAVSDHLEIKTGFLERNSFFRSCRPEELKTIAAHMHTRQYKPGTTIVNAGDPGSSMFLVAEGLLEVSLPGGPEHGPLVVGKLLAGDFFGEMSMLTDEPRSATVRSVTETVLYEIRRQHIHELVHNRPEIAEGMTHVAAERRLRNQNAEVALDSDMPSEEHLSLAARILEKMRHLFEILRD